MNRKNEKKLREEGSMSVEAILFVSLFLIFFIFMLNIMKLVITQTVMQYAVNQAAKEISQYSYVLNKLGVEDNIRGNAKKAATMNSQTNDAIDSVNTFYNSLIELTDSQNVVELIENGNQVYDNTGGMVETGKGYFGYLKENGVQDGIGTVKDALFQAVSGAGFDLLVQNRVKAHLETMIPGSDADTFLCNMGVVNGVDGINCAGSSLYKGGEKDLELIATYTIDYKMPFLGSVQTEITLRASTGLW